MRIVCWIGGWLVLAACGGESPPEKGSPPDLRPYADLGGDFVLVDQQGKAFALEGLRGRAALLFFGYTYCPHWYYGCDWWLMRIYRP